MLAKGKRSGDQRRSLRLMANRPACCALLLPSSCHDVAGGGSKASTPLVDAVCRLSISSVFALLASATRFLCKQGDIVQTVGRMACLANLTEHH